MGYQYSSYILLNLFLGSFCFFFLDVVVCRGLDVLGLVNRQEERVLLTSLLPRPKPLTTSPFSLSGNGGSGPLSGSRGSSGRMVFVL
jgi:hypothetical protein